MVIVIDLASAQSIMLPFGGNVRHYRMLQTRYNGLYLTQLGNPFGNENQMPYVVLLYPRLLVCFTNILSCQWEQICAELMFYEFLKN